jgi:hypothetical protein
MSFYWLGLASSAGTWPSFGWLQQYLGRNPNAFGSNSGQGELPAQLPALHVHRVPWPAASPRRAATPLTNSPGGDYQHWGMVSSGAARTVLPDNAGGGEWCGGASLGFAYDGAWGWDDRDCGVAQSFMCRWGVGRAALRERGGGEAAACCWRSSAPTLLCPPPALCCRVQPTGNYSYTSRRNNVTYVLSTATATQAHAELACQAQVGCSWLPRGPGLGCNSSSPRANGDAGERCYALLGCTSHGATTHPAGRPPGQLRQHG